MPSRSSTGQVTSLAAIAALAALGIVGNLAAYIIPIIVGSLITSGLSAREAGFVEVADMTGLAIGAFTWSRVIQGVNWKTAACCAIPLVVAGNLLCSMVSNLSMLMAGRVLSGLGSGLLLAIGNSGLAMTRNPDRTMGIVSVVSMSSSAVFLYVFTFLSHTGGMPYLFRGVALLTCTLFLAAFWLPQRSPIENATAKKGATTATADRIPWFEGSLALAGISGFFIAALVFWTYVERVAVSAGFSTAFIARSLFIAQLSGAAGALLTAVVTTRFGGRLVPMSGYITVAIGAALILASGPESWPFVVAACMLNFAWSGIYPFFIGTIITLDPSARLIGLTLTTQTASKALAPAIAGLLVTGTHYANAYYFAAVCFAISLALLLKPVLLADKPRKSAVC